MMHALRDCPWIKQIRYKLIDHGNWENFCSKTDASWVDWNLKQKGMTIREDLN